jgi:hypothetical protein
MPKRHPLPLWIVVSILLAAVTLVPLTCGLRSRPATPPTDAELSTVAELTKLLTQEAPELHRVPWDKYGSLELGFYLCAEARSWEQLTSLSFRN